MKKFFCTVLAIAFLCLTSASCSGTQVEYIGDYTATLYVDEDPIPYIVYIDETISSDAFCVYTLYLPYDTKYRRLDALFDPKEEYMYLDLGDDWTVSCKLKVGEIAPQSSFDWLPTLSLVSYGLFCGDRVTREAHFSDCPNASSIPRNQLVYFRNDNEACVLKFYFCPDCRERF